MIGVSESSCGRIMETQFVGERRRMAMDGKERIESARTEHGMTASEYWDRLTRSFNADYVRSVEERYDNRKRLQVA